MLRTACVDGHLCKLEYRDRCVLSRKKLALNACVYEETHLGWLDDHTVPGCESGGDLLHSN